MNNLTLLDCTLRDGGYYTQWDFAPELVSRYLSACETAGIEFVELGLRNFAKEGFVGPFAYTTDSYLERLELPAGLGIGVMVDAKTLLTASMPAVNAVHALFKPSDQSPVSLVRVAAHFTEIGQCGDIVGALMDLGYTVGVNLMQASGKPTEAIAEQIAAMLAPGHRPDVLYFADSLGNMDSVEVARIIAALRQHWDGPLGIHTHNNRGLAVANSLSAIAGDVTWIDATIQGMGRGAGNAEIELLLTELGDDSGYNPDPIYELAMDDFAVLRAKHRWGPSLLYYYSAKHGIHPTYAQELLADDRYAASEKMAIVRFLAAQSANSFNPEMYSSALVHHFMASNDNRGAWSAKGWCDDRTLVLVAAGPTSHQYAQDIIGFARDRNALLLTINTLHHIDDDAVNGVVTVDQNRVRFEAPHMQSMGRTVYAPVSSLPEDCTLQLAGVDTRDYGLAVEQNSFAMHESGCTLPYALSAIYALVLAAVGNARHVYLAGFDGYGPGDPRQQEMLDCIELMRERINVEELITAITPTNYPFRQGSLYAP